MTNCGGHYTLPPQKLAERANAIYVRMQKEGLTEPCGDFDRNDAQALAENPFPNVQSKLKPVSPDNLDFFRHFNLIQKYGYEHAHGADSPIWINRFVDGKKTHADILPGVL